MDPNSKIIKTPAEPTNDLAQFIQDTKAGKYTNEQPILTDITFQRFEVDEQEEVTFGDESEILLFGLSY